MKILHLATQDIGRGGGGFDAAYRLHCNMKVSGLESCMIVLHKNSDNPDVVGLADNLSVAGKLRQLGYSIRRRLTRRLLPNSSYFNIDGQAVVSAGQLQENFPFQPDVIIAHWVSGFVNTVTFRDLNRITKIPVLWYIVDMGAFTGGCHYAFGCDGYTRHCGHCPQLGIFKSSRDLSYRQWKARRACIEVTDLTAVAASSWLRQQMVTARAFQGKRLETILLGIDVDVFCPTDQETARKKLNLSQQGRIIFFGAHSLSEKRKGMHHLIGALRQLHTLLDDDRNLREQITIVIAGNAKNLPEQEILFEHRHIGFLSGDEKLATAYQAADIYVNASVEDSGPMMINEALLCGTPVVSFEMGVAIDLVHTDQTGYRARLKDEQDMANGLRKILQLDTGSYTSMRESCRHQGLLLCHPDVQVGAFRKLCQEVMQADKSQD